MASIKQVTIGSTNYSIIPEGVTSSSATYKASCPTLSANTTLEVTKNKTTTISSSSTDTQYPSAKAVYDAIQAAKPTTALINPLVGTTTSNAGSYIALVGTSGVVETGTYLSSLTLNSNSLASLTFMGSSTVNFIGWNNPVSTGVNCCINLLQLLPNDDIGGDFSIGTDSYQTGLYGRGTIYTAATLVNDTANTASMKASPYAFTGTIENRSNPTSQSTPGGGYIERIRNGCGAYIDTIENWSNGGIKEISNDGNIINITNSQGYIGSITLNGGTIGHSTGYRDFWGNLYTTFDGITLNYGTAYVTLAQDSTADLYLHHTALSTTDTSSGGPLWQIVNNGKVCPWVEVSNSDSLIKKLSAKTGILYKYTGATTVVSGITYTQNNYYRWEE